jgi:hypothetical protein
MRKLLFVLATLATWPAHALDSTSDYVLVSIGWANGSGAYIAHNGTLPEYASREDCQAAMRKVLAREVNRSHAEGGGTGYKCIRLGDFQYW